MTDLITRQLLETLLFPPGIVIVLGLLVVFSTNMRPRFMEKVLLIAMLLLWLCSTPAFSFWLLDTLQNRYPTLQSLPSGSDVVVILGGGSYEGVNEYGRNTMLDGVTLERARYGAWLSKRYSLPVITTGGKRNDELMANADILATYLEQDLGTSPVYREDKSLTTFENASRVSDVMLRLGVSKPLVVSQAWHLPRAMESFAYLNIEAQAAPTARQRPGTLDHGWLAWLPRASCLERTRVALHEWFGVWYYRFKLFR